MKPSVYAGSCRLRLEKLPVSGEQVRIGGEDFYRMANYDRMLPFFMSIVSDADHWMFISSTGSLTAGRGDADNALFPYYTDDKIHDAAGCTGSKTVVRVVEPGRHLLWVPFSSEYEGAYRVQRNLYKSLAGNRIAFEEVNEDLLLTFRYSWASSATFGFIRTASLTNSGRKGRRVLLMDGIQNLLPSRVQSQFQIEKSTLLDAYKRNELVPGTTLALYTLSSIPIDRPEPAECLSANTVWSAGLKGSRVWLSSRCFDLPQPATVPATEVRGQRGAYVLEAQGTIPAGRTMDWLMVADVNKSHSDIVELRRLLKRPGPLTKAVLADVGRGTEELRRIVAAADGLQKTSGSSNRSRREGPPTQFMPGLVDARHYANVLFNVMRGGFFPNGYRIDCADLRQFVHRANRRIASKHGKWLARLRTGLSYPGLVALASARDPQLERICREYLPLTFSRRHGDPSRPWNRFSISTRDRKGNRILNYEGNWRDIFQNWEALAISFPCFVPGMVCKFLNASTADGYNPYRITRDGLDWEVADPEDPWSFIGYWGDHQVIYLLKLLEILERHEPGTVQQLLTKQIFAFADVPYRIRDYEALLKDPRNTVRFDETADKRARARVLEIGADGKLLPARNGEVKLVNMTEKLLISVLAKLSNFIPDAGIWLNTQRPEWNDANNALVGNGASMVTLCYLRRYFAFLAAVFQDAGVDAITLSEEVAALLGEVHAILQMEPEVPITDTDRKRVLDRLGRAGAVYRRQIYEQGFSGAEKKVGVSKLKTFFRAAMSWMDASIESNRRPAGLFEAYNLVRFKEGRRISIRRLYPMLEGQVAALSSGKLSAEDSLKVLKSLRASALFRPDQHSYILYPDRRLPGFLEKNRLPDSNIRRSVLLKKLLSDGNCDLVERDAEGNVHFQKLLRNGADVMRTLERLGSAGYARLVKEDAGLIVEIFERLFDHESFTGRSGTFFAYEGLGSIYWHMVSKLLLAVQESFFRAVNTGAQAGTVRELAASYYDIRAGLGDAKTPGQYGAFPMDPYSHTPRHRGASQPGLTGQVKEDILCRWGELGVFVEEGRLCFKPLLLRKREFLTERGVFEYFDVNGLVQKIRLKAGQLGFTLCQVPVVYTLGKVESITVRFGEKDRAAVSTLALDTSASRLIFERTGRVSGIEVTLPEAGLCL